ncbi:MAG TPA: hypothetical protein VFY35_09115, partial [Burkholderiaceae bacterium]|nr:hypothetical protein [Burkholderiaceae bacterium]
MKIVETLRRWASEDAQVQAAADRRNLHVLGVAAWVLLALNGVHVLVFSLLRFDLPQQTAWAHQIAWAHAVMAVLMGAVGGLTRRAQAQPEVKGLGCWLPEVTSLGV